MSPVILGRMARAEFDEAADWYERQQAGLGAVFTAAVRELIGHLQSWPEAHPVVFEDVREALVARYPFAVYYRVRPDEIRVIAIFHTSRDPNEWQRRV